MTMSITGITDLYLYSDATPASSEAREYLDSNGIEYTDLCYRDPSQHNICLDALRTWWPDDFGDTEIPLLVYTEVDDSIADPVHYNKRFIKGEDLPDSEIVELYLMGT